MERELLLLGLLLREQMHGYQLHEFIDSNMQTCVDLKKPTAYYLLDKMAQQGLVTSHEEREGSRLPRQVYSITAEGRRYFEQLLRENLASYTSPRFPSNTGFIFLDNLAAEEATSLLQNRRAGLLAALAQVEEAPPHRGSLHYLIDHQKAMLQAEIDWLDEVIGREKQGDRAAS